MKFSSMCKLATLAASASLFACGIGTEAREAVDENVSELISGNVDFSAPAPLVEVISGAQSRVTAKVKLKGLTPGAAGTLTYSLGRQAFRHPYFSQTEVRTVTIPAGATEITDTVSTLCSSTRLPFTWFITGKLTTSAGTIDVQGSRAGARCD